MKRIVLMEEKEYARILDVLIERIENKETSNSEIKDLVSSVAALVELHRDDIYRQMKKMRE